MYRFTLSAGGAYVDEREFLDRIYHRIRREIRLQWSNRNVAVANSLVVGAIVRLPLVLPFFNPEVFLTAGIGAFAHLAQVIAFRLGRNAEAFRAAFGNVDVQK